MYNKHTRHIGRAGQLLKANCSRKKAQKTQKPLYRGRGERLLAYCLVKTKQRMRFVAERRNPLGVASTPGSPAAMVSVFFSSL